PLHETRTDVPLAGHWTEQRRLRPLDAAAPAVHRQLVAIARPEDFVADDSGRSIGPRRIVADVASAARRLDRRRLGGADEPQYARRDCPPRTHNHLPRYHGHPRRCRAAVSTAVHRPRTIGASHGAILRPRLA